MRFSAFDWPRSGIRAMTVGLLALGMVVQGGLATSASPYLPEESTPQYPRTMSLDLPAMVLNPEEYPVAGLGAFGGRLTGAEQESVEWREDDSLVDAFAQVGWRARYTGQAVLPRDDDPTLFSVSAQSYVTEFADDEGAARGFHLMEDIVEWPVEDVDDVRQVGDEAELTQLSGVHDALGEYVTLDYTFRSGNLVGGVMITWFVDIPATLVTPDEMADAAEVMLERMNEVREAGSVDLPAKMLRVETTAATAGNTGTDDYYFLDGNAFVAYDASAEGAAASQAYWEEQGINTIYVTWREFWAANEPDGAATAVMTYMYRLDTTRDARRFAAGAAQGYLDQRTETLSGEVLAGDQLPQVEGAVSGVSYTTTWPAGPQASGYRYWVQVGSDVVVLQLESSADVESDVIRQLMDAQLACLDASDFCEPIPAPKGLVN